MNLWNQYFEDCAVPSHPEACPKCSEKVGRYQINLVQAMFMCSNKNCPWPFDSVKKAEEISGKSDINKLVKAMKLEPGCCKKQQKSTNQETGLENR